MRSAEKADRRGWFVRRGDRQIIASLSTVQPSELDRNRQAMPEIGGDTNEKEKISL